MPKHTLLNTQAATAYNCALSYSADREIFVCHIQFASCQLEGLLIDALNFHDIIDVMKM